MLKNKGFSQEQRTAIFEELSLQTEHENVKIFTENIFGYLDNLLQKSLDLGEKSILCSSDMSA